jgi:N-acyl-D-aspartate/D-glutamate deacylase
MVCSVDDDRAKPYEGRTLQQAADALEMHPLDAALTLMDWDEGRMGIIFFYRVEEDMRAFLRHPLAMVGSDGLALVAEGILGKGKPHPRSYGAAARILGRYVREERMLTLEQAVHKMSGKVADRLGMKDRGRLTVGAAADVVVFAPDTVIDRATFQDPHQYARGIAWVLVNGRIVVEDGRHTGVLAGRVLEAG